MTFGEQLKACRRAHGLSQEKVAEHLGVSRQAVTKWENNQTMPSSQNLLALSALYGVSLDELAGNSGHSRTKDKTILHTNLTLLAIILQASMLNVWIQPIAFAEAWGVLLGVKLLPLAACSCWMAYNLHYEKNPVQYRKNVKIELMYCVVQVAVALAASYSEFRWLGSVGLLAVCLFYVFFINPKYMGRTLVRRKPHR